MRLSSAALLLPALLVACGDGAPSDANPASHGPAGHDAAPHAHDGAAHDHAAAPHAHEAAPNAHEATPHAHPAGHGGEVKTVGDLHVEGRFMRSGLMVWVNDAAEKPVDLTAVTGSAVIKGPAGITTVMLAPMGDHLHAAMTLPEGTAADAVVTLNVSGKPVSVDFRTTAVGSLAEHDHTSLHGGVVSMWQDFHVEYVVRGDEVRFYVTDAKRVPVKESVSGTVKIGEAVVPLTYDPATGALSAKAVPTGLVMLDATVGETTFSLGFGG